MRAHLASVAAAFPGHLRDDVWNHALTDEPATSVIEVPYVGTFAQATDALPELVEVARDAVAILRLFQRSHFTMDMEFQAFGLPDDRTNSVSHYWLTDSSGFKAAGTGWAGGPAPFTFRPGHQRAFYADARFRYLGEALSAPDVSRTEWQRQLLRAVRSMHVAQASPRPSSKVIAYAVALEAAFGDGPGFKRKKGDGSEGFRIARRAAMVSCRGEGIPRHGSGRPACDILLATSDDDLRKRLADHGGRCSAYENARGTTFARNAALHEAEDGFDESDIRMMRTRTDDAILSAIEWVIEAGAENIADLDEAMDSVPRPI